MDALYLAELMSQIDPAQREALLSGAAFEPQTSLNSAGMMSANKEIDRGMAFADTPMARGYNVGGTYVAASPLEHLANAMKMYRGEKGMAAGRSAMANAMAAQRENIGKYKSGLGAFLDVAGGPTPVEPLSWGPEPVEVPWQWQAPNFVGR